MSKSQRRKGAEGLGRLMSRRRHALNVSQMSLARAAGVTTRTVHKIENNPDTSQVGVLLSVLQALGGSIEIRFGASKITHPGRAQRQRPVTVRALRRMQELRAAGWPIDAIAAELGHSYETVRSRLAGV